MIRLRLLAMLLLLGVLTAWRLASWNMQYRDETSLALPPARSDLFDSRPEARTPDRTRILIIGNSLVLMHGGQDRALEDLSSSATRPAMAELIASGGSSLQRHWKEGFADRRIAEGNWDYVILQEYTEMVLNYPDVTQLYVQHYADLARKVGATPILMEHWARRDLMQDPLDLHHRMQKIAEATGCLLAPVGLAWHYAYQDDPTLTLYWDDQRHASADGSYLASITLYGVIFGGDLTATKASLVGGLVQPELEQLPVLRKAAQKALDALPDRLRPTSRPATIPSTSPVSSLPSSDKSVLLVSGS